MKPTSLSVPNGDSNGAITEYPPVTPSSSAGLTLLPKSLSTSDTSVISAEAQNQTDSQLTPNSPNSLGLTPNAMDAKMICTLANALGVKVFWRNLRLKDGQVVFALCFPISLWELDPAGPEIKPRLGVS